MGQSILELKVFKDLKLVCKHCGETVSYDEMNMGRGWCRECYNADYRKRRRGRK